MQIDAKLLDVMSLRPFAHPVACCCVLLGEGKRGNECDLIGSLSWDIEQYPSIPLILAVAAFLRLLHHGNGPRSVASCTPSKF